MHRSQILYARATKDGKNTEHVHANFHNAAFRLAALRIDSCTASKYAVGGDVAPEARVCLTRDSGKPRKSKADICCHFACASRALYPALPQRLLFPSYIFALARHSPNKFDLHYTVDRHLPSKHHFNIYYHRHHNVIQSAIKSL
jgi:hypothetical protein